MPMFKLTVSLIIVAAIAISLSRHFRLSSRYERKPRTISPWNAMDKGIDPTDKNDTGDGTGNGSGGKST